MKLSELFRAAAIEQSLAKNIRTVQELLGHEDLNTTAIYTHADAARGVSPLDIPAVPARPVLPALEWS